MRDKAGSSCTSLLCSLHWGSCCQPRLGREDEKERCAEFRATHEGTTVRTRSDYIVLFVLHSFEETKPRTKSLSQTALPSSMHRHFPISSNLHAAREVRPLST